MAVVRSMISQLRVYKDKYPILALTGPRQSGKTTLLRELFPEYTYLSLENPDLRLFAEKDPNGFLKQYNMHCIFDEVQRVPALFSYLQTLVDDQKVMGQFILSGSQNFHLLRSITQSLAGRVALFKLFPFDFQEMQSEGLLKHDYAEVMLKGFYPAIFDRDIPSKTFYNNYIQTYVERDITELVNIRDMRTFRVFLSRCASRAGQLLNLNSLANDCGITQPTAKAWVSLLESSYIIYLLQPYHKNFDKRVIKSPKLYFYDTGLLCHLLKIREVDQIRLHSFKGNLFENMMISEFVKRNYHLNRMEEFWFWRDSGGHEVDLIRQDDELLDIFEIKSTRTIKPELFKGLDYFHALAKEEVKSITLVYTGNESQSRTGVEVIAWNALK